MTLKKGINSRVELKSCKIDILLWNNEPDYRLFYTKMYINSFLENRI